MVDGTLPQEGADLSNCVAVRREGRPVVTVAWRLPVRFRRFSSC